MRLKQLQHTDGRKVNDIQSFSSLEQALKVSLIEDESGWTLVDAKVHIVNVEEDSLEYKLKDLDRRLAAVEDKLERLL